MGLAPFLITQVLFPCFSQPNVGNEMLTTLFDWTAIDLVTLVFLYTSVDAETDCECGLSGQIQMHMYTDM